MRLDRGHAMLVVTRTVENVGPKSDQATFHLDLPDGAVATRLRTAATNEKGESTWFEGDLLEAEEAARRYQELTGIGGYYPKDPALLSWRSQKQLALQVFPVPARSSKVVEYTLRMPLEYADGRYKLTLPKLGTDALPAKLHVVPIHPEDRVEVNGVEVTSSTATSGAHELEVLLTPRNVPPIDGGLASVRYANDKNLVHARVAAAPRLSEVPAQAAIVVLLDTSRSMSSEMPAALGAARSYLSQFPGSTVEVMTFDRKVTSPFGGFLSVGDAVSRLYTLAPKLGNGSQIDDALARADARLTQSSSATRRILVLTDLLTRQSLTPSLFAARALTSGALVHLSTIEDGSPSLERNDESPWSALPRKTGGLLWHAKSEGLSTPAARAVFLEWVRPTRIEKLTIRGMPSDFAAGAELREGTGVDFLGIASHAVPQVRVEGELWSKPVRWSMASSVEEGKRWAALVFGSGLLGSLDEAEQMTLAMHGRAVSPVTSYLAIEPGVRPSTEGLEWGTGEGGGGFGHGIGLGSVATLGHGGGGPAVDRQAVLTRALASALGSCGVTRGSASATVESTIAEVVDVNAVTLAPSRDAKIEACITEQLWGVTLPDAFVAPRAEWHLNAML